MSEPNEVKIVTAIITLLAGLFSVFIAFYGMLQGYWGLMGICLSISVIFAYFSWIDYQKIVKKVE